MSLYHTHCFMLRLLLQFRARSLYEYTDWGDLQYQAEKRLFGDSSEEERMGFDRMNTEEYVEYYQNQPVETPQFVPVQQ